MRARRRSLARRFYLVLLLVFVAGSLAWGLLAAREAGERLAERSDDFIESGAERIDDVLTATADQQAELMERAVAETAGNLGREFADLPFDLFRDREDLLLEYLRERLDGERERQKQNAAVIAEIFRERAHERAESDFADLMAEQEERVDLLARDLSRELLAWGGFFLVGLAGLLGLVFHGTVVKPLRTATEVIESMRSGDMSRRLPPGESEEIGRLTTSFNAMADVIETQHRELEDRVAEKTAALSSALDEQRETNERLRQALADLESAQQQLVESAKMAALGTMARGMAHEFNNILGGISGCAADLSDDIVDPDSRRVLDVIQRTSKRALVITENLLSFSRGSTHGKQMVDFRALLDEAVALVEPEAAHRGVAIELDDAESLRVLTDGRGLQQVLLNLLINAVQACATGGHVRAALVPEGDHAVFEIEDDGRGIAAEHRERIFEPFFTTKETAAGSGGTGLGLSVAQGIVTRMGGKLEARSEGEGKGATFRVVVPLESPV